MECGGSECASPATATGRNARCHGGGSGLCGPCWVGDEEAGPDPKTHHRDTDGSILRNDRHISTGTFTGNPARTGISTTQLAGITELVDVP